MTKEDLNFVADALIALVEKDGSAPCLTEGRLLARMRLDDVRRSTFAEMLAPDKGAEYLLESECREIFEQARLAPSQSEVLRLRLAGRLFEEIGRIRHHSKQGAQQIFMQALKKLARSYHVYPYRGLSEVYEAEVRRGLRRGFGTMHP